MLALLVRDPSPLNTCCVLPLQVCEQFVSEVLAAVVEPQLSIDLLNFVDVFLAKDEIALKVLPNS